MFIARIFGFCGDGDADRLIYLEPERNKVIDKIWTIAFSPVRFFYKLLTFDFEHYSLLPLNIALNSLNCVLFSGKVNII